MKRASTYFIMGAAVLISVFALAYSGALNFDFADESSAVETQETTDKVFGGESMAPPPPGADQFNVDVTSDVPPGTAVNAGDVVIYTINYSTASNNNDFDGASITVFIPAELIELVSFSGTPDVSNTTFVPVPGGYEFTINFLATIPAGSQGMMELAVIYPPGSTCPLENIGLTVDGSATAGGVAVADDTPFNNTAGVFVLNDLNDAWEIVLDGMVGLPDATSSFTVTVNPLNMTPLELQSDIEVTLNIPDGAVVNSCDGCTQTGNTLEWNPAGPISTAFFYNVVLTLPSSDFQINDFINLNTRLKAEVGCPDKVNTADNFNGQIIASPDGGCLSGPTLSTYTIGNSGTLEFSYGNTGNVAIDDFTVVTDFPKEIGITEIPAATYSEAGLEVQVTYSTTVNTNQTYTFTTSDVTASGGLTLPGGEYLTTISYTFLDPVPVGFATDGNLSFDYTVLATDLMGNPVVGAHPCEITNCSNPNINCLETNIGVTGDLQGSQVVNSGCSDQDIARILPAIDDFAKTISNADDRALSTDDVIDLFNGDQVTYTINFSTTDAGPLVDAIITDGLPAGLTFVGAPTYGGGITAGLEPAFDAGTGTWDFTGISLPADEDFSIT